MLFICYLPKIFYLVELVRFLKYSPNSSGINNQPTLSENEMLSRKEIVIALNAFIISNVLAAIFGGAVAILMNVPGSSCG